MVELSDRIAIRLTEYDREVLTRISTTHPHIADLAGLAREALRQWDISHSDENSKGKRLERIERMQVEMMERLLSLENKVERVITKAPVPA